MFEKKRGKRFLASVMALVMLLSLAPVGALAAENKDQQENTTVSLPADEANPKPVETGTANTNEETTPPPANEGIAVLPANNNNAPVALPETPVIVKPTEVLDQAFGVDSNTSKDNGIAEYKGNNDGNYVNSEPTATEKMAELWITNAPVTANGSNSVSINSDIDGITTDNGVLVSELAPEKGISGDNNVVFWQARILDSNHKQMIWQKKQTKEGHEAEAFRCKEITNRSSSYYQLQYKNENNAWTNIKSSDQIVFYYTAVTNLLQDMIQINITDWPRTDGGDNTVTYEVYVDDENTPTNQIITYYNTQDRSKQGRTTVFVDNVSVDMNQLEKYKVKKIERQYANQNAEELSVNNSQSNFSIDLDNGNCTIKIYLERYKYVLSYELNEGSIASGTTYTLAGSYKENETITAPASESMSRAGYTFDGWYMDVALENPWTGDKMPSKDLMLYAKWTKTNPAPDPDPNPTPGPSTLVPAKFFINLGGKDASKPDGSGLFTRPAIVINEAINLDVFKTHSTKGYGNNGYIFIKDGVKKQYPTLLTQEPTSVQINEKLPADKKGSMSVGEGTNREVVWYHVSDCTNMSDGYHVDGYIKNVAIKITYDPDGGIFEGEETSKNHVENGKSGEVHTIIQNTPTKEGYTFTGWKLDGNDTLYQPEGSIVPTGDVTLVAQWEKKVTLTYHENFGEKHTYTISVDKNSPQTVQSYAELRRLYGVFEKNTGFYFDEWNTQADGTGASHKVGSTIPMTGSIDLYAQWKQARVPKVAYTINQHFMNGKGEKDSALDKLGTTQSANKDTALSELIKDLAKNQTIGNDRDNYMYVSGKYTTKSESKKDQPIESGSKLTEDTTIDLYYYLDNWKDAGEAGKDSENGGDDIPDCDQVLIKYVSSNSERGTVSPDMEVLTLRKDNENVQIKINGSKATDNGGRNYFSNWTEDNTQVSTNATLNHQTILDVIKEFTGGKTYTFTANFGYSSGGGSGGSNRPKPPVVEIPDDVPTGLNGKDHYAYIIGYGNNDVRPQNNITRAEVATIFFRLLTDETREANMTKSNGYNDVKDGDWFCCAVSTLSKMGIIKGYEDGSFKPNDPISRAEFAAIAARFDPDGDKTPATFADVTSHWAKDEISIAANHGWIKGYEDGSFKPDQKITRAETMTLVNRVLNRLPETKDDLHKDMKTWVDNMDETAWYYLAVQEATNSHYFKNKTGTKFEQWTDLRDTRDWSELEK